MSRQADGGRSEAEPDRWAGRLHPLVRRTRAERAAERADGYSRRPVHRRQAKKRSEASAERPAHQPPPGDSTHPARTDTTHKRRRQQWEPRSGGRLHALVSPPCSLLWKTSNTVNLPNPPNIIHMSRHVLGLHLHYPAHLDFLFLLIRPSDK
jgi:hypothetical protein